jgi:hypothetical protein
MKNIEILIDGAGGISVAAPTPLRWSANDPGSARCEQGKPSTA